MPGLKVTRSVTVAVDELVGIGELERAALEFARTAPAELIAVAVTEMIDTLIDEVVGPCGLPRPDDEQPVAPWACPGCASMRGFRRRGAQVRQRQLTSVVGVVALTSKMLGCRSCDRRFSPLGQLLDLAPRQRRTDALTTATAALAVEVAYAKAARLMAEVGGVVVSPRTIRRDLIDRAPERIEPRPELGSVPVLLLDGTGERAGPTKSGVGLHIAVGIVARQTVSGRRQCRVELLAGEHRDLDNARTCLDLLADNLELDGAPAAATHLRRARGEVFTFLTDPTAGRLVAGHKGRPDVGTGVLERVMREMNRRTDVGVRWSIPGVRAMLMTKLEHKYHHGRWSPEQTAATPPIVRMALDPLPQRTAA